MPKSKESRESLLKGLDFLEGEITPVSLLPDNQPAPEEEDSVPSPEKTLSLSQINKLLPTAGAPQKEKKFLKTAFGKKESPVYTAEEGQLCPHCRYSVLEECESFSGKPCEFFVYCPNCNAYICTYRPMPHQAEFHRDPHMKKLYAGGFGSAKTYTCGMEFIAHVLQIPNAVGLMGAATWGQASDTCLKFVCDNLPKKLVARSNQDKVSWYINLVNGSRISAKAFDKEGKIRSANLTIVWVEEASEVDYSVIVQLGTRLRNKSGFFKGQDRLKLLLSSNPDVGWLNTEWLMCSDAIYYHGDVADRYTVDPARRDPVISTHISATSANIYLPPHYEENLAKNREQWWVNRYLKGSFKYTEGLVYPNFTDWFIEPFEIPDFWKRITGTDFGRRDPTAHLVAALDPINKIIYVYAEVEESLDDRPLDWIVEQIRKVDNFPPYLLAYPHQCDPRGRNRDQVSGQTWIDAYREKGIVFQPAQDCDNQGSIAPTIQKVYNYASHGRLKVFNTCRKLKNELSRYKYAGREVGDDKNKGEVPLDKNNHLPDALRYMLAPFPQFPEAPEDFDEIWQNTVRKVSRQYNPLSYDDGEEDTVTCFGDNFG